MENGFNKLDLTGKLIIKATLGCDTRLLPIHNDDLTYDELILMMHRVFKGCFDQNETDLLLKYKDEDGDLVTIQDNSDLAFAIQYCRILKLHISTQPESKPLSGNLTKDQLDQVVKELREVRVRVDTILDRIADADCGKGGDPAEESALAAPQALENGVQEGQVAAVTESKEFDPLNQGEEVQEGLSEQLHLSTSDSVTPALPPSQPIMSPGPGPSGYPQPGGPRPVAPESSHQPPYSYPGQPQAPVGAQQPPRFPGAYPTYRPTGPPTQPPAGPPSQPPTAAPSGPPSTPFQGGPPATNPAFQPGPPSSAPYPGAVAPPSGGLTSYPGAPSGPPTSAPYQPPPSGPAAPPSGPPSGYPGAPPTSSIYPGGAPASYMAGPPTGPPTSYPSYPTPGAGVPNTPAYNPFSRGPTSGYSHPTSQSQHPNYPPQ